MSSPHIIRLRDPWEKEQLTTEQIQFIRRFGQPTGLGPRDRVELVLRVTGCAAQVFFNGQVLADSAANGEFQRWEVSADLQPRNELRLLCEASGSTREPQVEARLEILSAE